MIHLVSIAAGGAIGALARYYVSKQTYSVTNSIFPWGTILINLSGCFLIGICFELFDKTVVPPGLRSFITIGFLGAFTTFSTYSIETINLARGGEYLLAGANVVVQNVLGLALAAAGVLSMRMLMRIAGGIK